MKRLLFTLLIIFFLTPLSDANAQTPIKILIVPGHDNEVWGAQYGNLKEADMNLELATRIYNTLIKDRRFDVHITRNSDGYTKEFADYFVKEADNIYLFKEVAKAQTQNKIKTGQINVVSGVPHNSVSPQVGMTLYGINKWANENNMDAVIHIHFNDHVRKSIWEMGKFKGFAVYMPEDQMVNAKESQKLAGSIFKQLDKRYVVSNYSAEAAGMVPSQSLIAIGSNGTLASTVRSVLVEYGYIYRFGRKGTRQKAYLGMASATVAGIKQYFKIK